MPLYSYCYPLHAEIRGVDSLVKAQEWCISFVGDYSFKRGLDVLILILDVLLQRENEGISIAQIKMENMSVKQLTFQSSLFLSHCSSVELESLR